MPIARPRRWGGNQPTTIRPLAEPVQAANIPTTKSTTTSGTVPCTMVATMPRSVVPPRPASSTARSPMRSTTRPQTKSVTITPAIGAAATVPASARESPRSSCSCGIRKAGPLIATEAPACAATLAASIDQRRATEMLAASREVTASR